MIREPTHAWHQHITGRRERIPLLPALSGLRPLAAFSPSTPTPTNLADNDNVEMGEFANDAGEVTEEAHPGESHNDALEEDAVLGEDFDQLDR